MQNIFAAGTDALLYGLAQREAEQQRLVELERQAQREQQRQFENDRQFGLQERQLKSVDDDRKERQSDRDAATQEKTTQQRLLEDTIHAYQTAPDEATKAQHRSNLEMRFGMKFEKPVEKKPVLHNVAPGGRVIDEDGKVIFTAPDRPRAESTPRPTPKATPAQIAAAGRRAMLDAQAAARNGTLPEGVTPEQYAMELRDQALTDLGEDPSKHPIKTVARPQPTPPMALPDVSEAGVAAPNRGQDIALPMEGPRAPAPAAAPPQAPPAAKGVSVRDPTGKLHSFATQAEADAFKKLAGIK